MDLSKFWIVAVISNPVRYQARVTLMQRFQKYVERYGANLCIVELTYGDRPYSIVKDMEEPRCHKPQHIGIPWNVSRVEGGDLYATQTSCKSKTTGIQLNTYEELWHKENMINIGISRLPNDWEYVAWIDADVEFKSETWLEETWHQLQHHYVVQMFAQAIDYGPKDEILQVHNGFMYMYWKNKMYPPQGAGVGGYYGYGMKGSFWHPGYAWAARREAIDYLGQLMDFPIMGAADHHMALALIGEAERSLPGGISYEYRERVMLWQDRALKYIKRDVGYVNTTLHHHWHGKKKDRMYIERWDALTSNKYNPKTDIKKDSQGVLQLVVENERQIRLRDDIRLYLRGRNEDSIDLE